MLWFSIVTILYFVIHSVLATPIVKIHFSFKYYRLFYNIVSIISLFPLLLIYIQYANHFIHQSWWIIILGLILLLDGIIIIIVTFRFYDSGLFFGWDTTDRKEELQKKGIHQYVRHPLYFGSFLALWGGFLLFRTDLALIYVCISTAYLIIGTRLEETKLVKLYGTQYKKYMSAVPRLIPNQMLSFHQELIYNIFN